MPLLERHHDHAIIDCDRRTVGEGPVIRARRHPEIVDNQIEVLLRYDLADLVLDLLKDLLGDLDASARGRAHMELDHAAVDGGIEITADKDEHHGAEREHQDGECRDDHPAGQQHGEQRDIRLAQMLEAALERRVETREQAVAGISGRRAVRLTLQQMTDRNRCQCSRQAIGSEHREDDGEPERCIQIFRGPFEKHH